MGNSVFEAQRYTDRTLIESILSSFYILDYGIIKAVNSDKTIDVVHAKKLKMLDGTELKQTVTHNVEVLTLSCSAFSLSLEYKKGDKVLLLGLKNYIPKTKDVTSATETTVYQHYTRECLKAIPLCVFSSDAKVKIEVEAGNLKATADKNIELNGNSKQFVTWTELNTALTQFVTQLSTALMGACYDVLGVPTPLTWTAGNPPTTLDISSAKTKTVVTGG